MHHTIDFAAVDAGALERACNEVLRRHDVLRTTFRCIDGTPVQIVHPPRHLPLPVIDFSEQTSERRERKVRRIVVRELQQIFDLEQGPLLNLTLLRLEPRHHVLSVAIHHIVFDDWSVEIFDRELHACYADAKAGRPFSLPAVPLQFASFVSAQQSRFEWTDLDPQLVYWQNQLRKLPAAIAIPTTDRPRPETPTYAAAIRKFSIGAEPSRAFRTLTRRANVTLFMSALAAFAVLLSRISGATDVLIGSPIANRNGPDAADLIGFLVNTIVLRVDLGFDPSFNSLLAKVRETVLDALANQDVPFEMLVEELRPQRETGQQPLIQTMFIFQADRGLDPAAGPRDLESSGAKFDLVLTIVDAAQGICGELEYSTELFERDTMIGFAAAFEALVGSIVADPDRPVSRLALLSPDSRDAIVASGCGPPVPRSGADVIDLIAAVAAVQPDRPAASFGDVTLDFATLLQRAADVAARLTVTGLEREARIGLVLDRTPNWVVGMLGILASEFVLVPLDPSLPTDRIGLMMDDADVTVVLTERRFGEKLPSSGIEPIYLDDFAFGATPAGRSVATHADGTRLAYIIFTSGSTGRPKGVLVEHAGLANLALAQADAWTVGPAARVLQFASMGFDAAMSEVFSTLCAGGHLVLAPSAETMPGPRLLKTLRDLRITHVTLPPSALAAMQPETLPDLRVVIAAGESCAPDLARRWAQGRRLFNAYGPTEATVCATMHEYIDGDDMPIGRPIPNVQVYVLDRHGEPVPPGVTGEIHIGGIGVARGYLNRPELTADKFIPDPFAEDSGGRLYRTGDLGRFDAAGVLHYRGRADVQLKIRGYRIEPGEVESVLRRHPNISDALVVSHGTGAEGRLIAFYIPDGAAPLVIELRSFLGRFLADYMTPAAYISLDAWPKTANGKIDRAALPRPDAFAREIDGRFVAPAGTLEEKVAAIWRDCLGVAEVGTSDNFFDLGGHSLLLVKVHDQLREKLGLDLSLMDLFRYPTIKLQASMLAAKLSSRPEAETLGRTDQRAARQNAARQQRRQRVQGHRDQGQRDQGERNA